MSKRCLSIDWKTIQGALTKRRKLHLNSDENGIYLCIVQSCLHIGFKSERGLRKHINTKHEWFYYFDKQPNFDRSEATKPEKRKLKASTHKQLAFSITDGSGYDFWKWLTTPFGGDRAPKEATQIARRGMKFLMYAMGENNDGEHAQDEFIDTVVGSPQMLMSFVKVIMEDWGLQASATLAYVKAINDLLDFRKASGVSDDVLRSFAVTEVYLRRGKFNLARRKNMEYSRNLDLESLIARKSWASLEQLEEVIPHHTHKYRYVVKKCKDGKEDPTVSELAFATRFISTFLFLRVKCTRPMSFQYMTLAMVEEAVNNGGYIHQTQFKTSEQFLFDTLILSENVITVLNSYIEHIRPFLTPKCDYVVISTKGTQYSAMGNAMSLLVHQAIGLFINPTRYRQIVETESSKRLTTEQREVISKDLKHGSYVAKRSYQKDLSRDIALQGATCMQELVGTSREEHTHDLASELRNISVMDNESVENATILGDEVEEVHQKNDDFVPESDIMEVEDSQPVTIPDGGDNIPKDDVPFAVFGVEDDTRLVTKDDIEVKKEELEDAPEKKSLRFTPEEDAFIRKGYLKYAKSTSRWANILKDSEYTFHNSRTRDSIRMRATTLKIGGKKKKGKAKSK